ncbi:MAG TPA: hypothetical protein VFU78_07080 [Thermomicrobiales bacterium]|nr:hypothetical protein [Thermomicrobiales bacterium]
MSGPAGVPAIQPSLPYGSALTPRFTSQDVAQYARRHPHPQAVGGARVESVEFLSGGTLRRWYTWASQLPAQRLFCLVTWTGAFRVGAAGSRPAAGSRAWQVFDATSGNLLLSLVGS